MHARIRGSSDCNRACTVGLPGAAFLHINAGQENQLEALSATWWGEAQPARPFQRAEARGRENIPPRP